MSWFLHLVFFAVLLVFPLFIKPFFFYLHFALQTLWEGGFYKLQLTFPQDYPFSPPKCELCSEIRNNRRHWPRPWPVTVCYVPAALGVSPYCHPPISPSKFSSGHTWMQGCALRKIEGSPVRMIWMKNLRFSSRPRAKVRRQGPPGSAGAQPCECTSWGIDSLVC